MSHYKYDNPDDAYKEAQRRIKKAKGGFLRQRSVRLFLEGLPLTVVPPEIGQLTKLSGLYLNNNQLTALPPEFGKLTKLKTLHLENNQLASVFPEICQLTKLNTLDISGNQLTAIPPEIGQLVALRELFLGNGISGDNKISQLPTALGQLKALRLLDLGGNQLTSIPLEIGQLTALRSLKLSKNKLTSIPPEIGQLATLETLDLSRNKLTDILSEIGQLVALRSLYLSSNQIAAIPPEIGQLVALQSLDLDGNQLTAVPPEINQLMSLETLDLKWNYLTTIPEWLVQMPQLEKLYISGNPITQPPPEILKEALNGHIPVDLEAVRRYYAQLAKEGKAYFYEAKLLLIGEGGAGKTSLAHKLLHPTHPLPAAEESTEGINVHQWQFDISAGQDLRDFGQKYTTNIWDFGGQSIYHATHQFFLSNRSVYILLTDTRRQHTDFYDWLQMQEAFGGESPLLLLKNQNRTHGSQCVIDNLPRLQERYANLQEIVQLDLSGVPDKEAEAWSDFLRYLKRHLLNLNHIGQPVPKTWAAVRRALDNDGRESISRRDYLAICAEQGIDDPANALQLSQFLHDIGDILHYQDDNSDLTDLIILNPLWTLDAVYSILDNEKIGNDGGEFSRDQLRDLWDEPKYDNHHIHLLELMQRFQLCYELPQRGHYIASQLLAPGPRVSAYAWETEADDLQLHYRYPSFMPRGIFSRAIVALHHLIEDQRLVWRTGVILRDDYARAELLEFHYEKEIHIRIGGSLKRDLLMEIVRTLDKLHEGFSSKLTYEKLVPCRCETCITSATPHFFSLHKLRERLANRKESVECNNPPYAEVQIRGLIDDAILQTDGRGGDVHYHRHINVQRDYYEGDNIHGDKIEGDRIEVGEIKADSAVIGRDSNASTS